MKFHAFPSILTALALAFPLAAAALDFRAPGQAAEATIKLSAPKQAAEAAAPAFGKQRVGDVRALPKAAPVTQWEPVEGGFVARLHAESAAAEGLRVRLDLGTMAGPLEVRVQGSADSRVESMVIDPARSNEAWTPWTEGSAQQVEIFSATAPSIDAIRVGAVLHMTVSPVAKVAASCTLPTACTSGDPALDAQIAERKKSMLRIAFVSGGGGFVCTATLIETPRAPSPYVLTANHCVDEIGAANSITAFWFYDTTSCENLATAPGRVQTAGGMQLVFTNFNVDSTLLLMSAPPPAGATYAPLNANLVGANTPIVSLSHPTGDSARWADGVMAREIRDLDRPYDMYFVTFSRGMIQSGSSGSGAYVRANGRLELTGVLSQGPIDGSCANTNKFGAYGRLEAFYPQMSQYIGASSPAADDAPNRPTDVTAAISATPVDALAQPLTFARRIDYAGDIDVFRFTVSSRVAVTAYSTGALDLVSTFLDANGVALEANDDAGAGDTNTGITRELDPGTYYLHIAHWTPSATGPYSVVIRTDRVDANYTALWWNASESGWGVNLNHQGNIIFATLFTYGDDGSPMWLVMSRGDRQGDGSYSGTLHRTTGPAFNAIPWTAVAATQVGTMRLVFNGPDMATMTYTFNGRTVTKVITRQLFKQPPACSWSWFDRTYTFNFQDLWWNPLESGWGINFAHQEETLFATLFTYAANGQGLWLVMPSGEAGANGTFTGALYRTRGPVFDASPWSVTTPTQVGTMSVDFSDGNNATLAYTIDGVTVNKTITRQVFSTPKTKCVS